MLLFIYVLLILGAGAGAVAIVRSIVENRVKGAKRAHRQVAVAERALRSIANGSGNSVLEAQIALDDIANLYETKELN